MDSNQVEESVKHSITKNGFPKKIVKLPFKPVYDCCKQYGTSLTVVLENLAKEHMHGKVKGDFIEFRAEPHSQDKPNTNPDSRTSETLQEMLKSIKIGQDGANASLNIASLQKQVLEQMSKMSPEQIEALKKKVDNLSEEEKKNLLKLIYPSS